MNYHFISYRCEVQGSHHISSNEALRIVVEGLDATHFTVMTMVRIAWGIPLRRGTATRVQQERTWEDAIHRAVDQIVPF
jgi:hypothetical protein